MLLPSLLQEQKGGGRPLWKHLYFFLSFFWIWEHAQPCSESLLVASGTFWDAWDRTLDGQVCEASTRPGPFNLSSERSVPDLPPS